ncbi:MAG: 7-cyano-7-deazaguanine synthase QueC [Planctomycetota bacterium]
MGKRAVILLSGGLDSAVSAAWARAEGFELITLSVDYGQRHSAELAASEAISEALQAAEHVVLSVNLRAVGGSALTGDTPVPKDRDPNPDAIPPTYVPARNTLFLALALGLAEARGASAIVIGANRLDYSGYPDCRPEFLEAFQRLAAVATKAGVEGNAPKVLSPLLDETKSGIVRLGTRLMVPLEKTLSCYDPPGPLVHCGKCEACRLRRRGFEDANVPDPTTYAA